MATSPTTRTLELCRKNGWTVCKAEYWQHSHNVMAVIETAKIWASTGEGNPLQIAIANLKKGSSGVRRDLFGFIDIVAIGSMGILGIQATSAGNKMARRTKILTECEKESRAWIMAGGLIEVWGWKKLDKPVNRKFWVPDVLEITAKDYCNF